VHLFTSLLLEEKQQWRHYVFMQTINLMKATLQAKSQSE
jgi:hypothetical protein